MNEWIKLNAREVEQKIRTYYESKGYEVYCVEVWIEFEYPEGTFVDIEIGGSREKYCHMRGYKSDDYISKLLTKVGVI